MQTESYRGDVSTVMLLDGNSLTYRAFFALPTDMATASGQVTNAVFGFTSMLVNLIKDHHPDRIVVAWDRPEPTFRHDTVPNYKAQREAPPDILQQQKGLVRQVIDALQIPMIDAVGYEADDVIATLATEGRNGGFDVIIVTGDRDAYQLVDDPYVKVLYNRRGVSDYVLYDEAGIYDRTGVTPVQYPEYAALRGDPSDNLPGVPGVGEKTAAKLINDFGGIDGVYANLDQLTPKLRSSLVDNEATVRMNITATPLVRDVPLERHLEGLQQGEWDRENVRQLFNFLEFRSLWDRLLEATSSAGEKPTELDSAIDVLVRVIHAPAEADELFADLIAQAQPISVEPAWSSVPGRSALCGLGIAIDDRNSVFVGQEALRTPRLKELFGSLSIRGHGVKELVRWLLFQGIATHGIDFDTKVAAYLVDPADTAYALEELAARYLHVTLSTATGTKSGQLDLGGDDDLATNTAIRAAAVDLLIEHLHEALRVRGLQQLYETIENPLVGVLARMEFTGVRVDVDELRRLNKELTQETNKLDSEIQELAGEAFRVNSTQQLRTILFDKLKLAPQKKTKTGFSTDAASLEKLRGQHPIVEKLLRYREVDKLRSTYGEGLLAEVADDGRIHATFNQTVARTGRLSSDAPNLHNIPIRSDEGRKFRQAFLPAEGYELLVADYNQIELRVIAHLAQDPGLIDAFERGTDIHNVTAARVFGVAESDVIKSQRAKAKMVSYGLAYGMESFGLAQRLGIAVDEADTILRAYFVAFPSVKAYMDATVDEARDKGYTETLFGRRRLIPELSSTNFRIRQAGERQAMNAGIQGLAADIFKVALVKLDDSLSKAGLQSRVVLQVHDEIVVEAPPEERDLVETLTLDAMQHAAELSVPLEVNIGWAKTWADAK